MWPWLSWNYVTQDGLGIMEICLPLPSKCKEYNFFV